MQYFLHTYLLPSASVDIVQHKTGQMQGKLTGFIAWLFCFVFVFFFRFVWVFLAYCFSKCKISVMKRKFMKQTDAIKCSISHLLSTSSLDFIARVNLLIYLL